MFGRREALDAWPFAVTDAAIRYRVARPENSGVENFDCGDEWWSEEVNTYVREKSWADHQVIVPLEFGLDGVTVGFAFVVLTSKRHPDSAAPQKALYEAIVFAGINRRFRKTEDPASPDEHLSETMFRGIEEHARGLAQHPVGLWLQVRAANARAIDFYKRINFEVDSRGVFVSTDHAKKPTIEMRKSLYETADPWGSAV